MNEFGLMQIALDAVDRALDDQEPPLKCRECPDLQDVVDYPAGQEYGSVTYYDQCVRKGGCDRG
jgi:hypothetical protein